MPKKSPLKMSPSLARFLTESGFFVQDFSKKNTMASAYWESLGYCTEDINNDLWISLLHPDDKDRVSYKISQVREKGPDVFEDEYRIRDSSGSWRWVRNKGRVLERDMDGHALLYVGIDIDITSEKEAESLLRLSLKDLETKFRQAETLRVATGLVVSGLDQEHAINTTLEQAFLAISFSLGAVYLLENDVFKRAGVWGWIDEELSSYEIQLNHEVPHLRVVDERMPIYIDNMKQRYPSLKLPKRINAWLGIPLLFGGTCIGVMEYCHQVKGWFTKEHIWSAMAFADSLAVALSNVSHHDQARNLAENDALTGLRSRSWFEKKAIEFFVFAKDHRSHLSVLMMDLDKFKRVNDTHGHPIGDEVLRSVGAVCNSIFRKSDVVARYGGEEFVVLLPGTDIKHAYLIAERLREAISLLKFSVRDLKVTTSIGISSLRKSKTDSMTDLIAFADKALYEAKNNGRNLVVCYNNFI